MCSYIQVIATKEDISACFRLLLGRSPNPEEIHGHFSLAGAPLDAVVGSYLQSLEFQSRGLLAPKTNASLVAFEDFAIYVDPEDRMIGANIRPGYEPELTRIFSGYVKPGSSVLDIGANCGYFSLLACSLGATVYAFEPLASNVRLLMASRARNGWEDKLHVFAAAASAEPGTLSIGAAYSDGVVGELSNDPRIALRLDYTVAVRIDDMIPADADISFLKIDVEGHEPLALAGAARTIGRCRPVILTELAIPALAANAHVSGRDYLEQLRSSRYRLAAADDPGCDGIEAILALCGRDRPYRRAGDSLLIEDPLRPDKLCDDDAGGSGQRESVVDVARGVEGDGPAVVLEQVHPAPRITLGNRGDCCCAGDDTST